MRRIFQLIGALALFYFGFLLASYFYSGIFPNNFEGFNQYAGGVGGLAFAVLSLFVGGSEEASKGVTKNITNAFNQIGLINISVGNKYNTPTEENKKEEGNK